MDNIVPDGEICEEVLRHEPEDVPVRANHDSRLEREPASEFATQFQATNRPPDHEGACRADIHHVEERELRGESRRPESPVAANVQTLD
jgi:hypothetical protein